MEKLTPKEKKNRRRMWLSAIVLFFVALAVSIWWMGPAPPHEITLATGEKPGIYAAIGKEYKKRLEKMGLAVTLKYTDGSLDNLHLLLDKKVDVAFVQAGTYAFVENEDKKEALRGLVAIQWEPVWIFFKGSKQVGKIYDAKGLTIGVGKRQSGTAAVALSILKANGIEKDNTLVHLSMQETHDELIRKDGKLDAGFFVTSASNELIQDLIDRKDIYLFEFKRQLAYSRRFPFMSPVTLGEGVIDLQNDVPGKDIKMFAVPTLMVCREDFHPQAVEQLLIAARRIHNKPAFVSDPQKFPTLEGMDLPVHETAAAYMHSGESLLTRLLPYWGVWLVYRLQILLIPLLVVWLPFFRLLPLAYTFRINWLLRKHYAALREIEDNIEKAERPDIIHEQVKELDNLRKNMEKLSRKIPTHLQINVYQWRLHVSHVRAEAVERLWHLQHDPQQSEVHHEPVADGLSKPEAPAKDEAAT